MNNCCIRTLIILILQIVVLTGGTSCRGEKSVDEDTLAYLDMAADPADNKAASDTLVTRKFASAAEATEFMRNSGHYDSYERGIVKDMLRYNLKYAEKLLNNHHLTFLIVDKETMKVVLYDRYGVEMARYPIACSRRYGTKHARRDNRTPEGFFYAAGVFDSSDWLYTDDDGNTSDEKGVYGRRFIRLSIPGVFSIGIHGTNAPWSIGSRCSHGCIRMNNADVVKLAAFVEAGTPIIVSPSRRDIEVNASEGYSIPTVALSVGGPRVSSDIPLSSSRLYDTSHPSRNTVTSSSDSITPQGEEKVDSTAPAPSSEPAQPVSEPSESKPEPK